VLNSYKSYPDWLKDVEKNGYHSYLNNRNFSSIALASDFYSIKNQRWCYAASPLEKKHFHYLEFIDDVAGYLDQYPINPEISLRIAKSLNLRHHSAGKEPAIVTIDTVVIPSDESENYALSVKTEAEISKRNMLGDRKAQQNYKRLKEKLLIEKKSSEDSGISWFLTTDKDEFYYLYDNLVWMYRGNFIFDSEKQIVDVFVCEFGNALEKQDSRINLQSLQEKVSNNLKIKLDQVKRVFSYACWKKLISFDLAVELKPHSMVDKCFFKFN